jgi:hypothetical protein
LGEVPGDCGKGLGARSSVGDLVDGGDGPGDVARLRLRLRDGRKGSSAPRGGLDAARCGEGAGDVARLRLRLRDGRKGPSAL